MVIKYRTGNSVSSELIERGKDFPFINPLSEGDNRCKNSDRYCGDRMVLRRFTYITIAIILILPLLATFLVVAPPPPPSRFYGTVNDGTAEVALPVLAEVDGVAYGRTDTQIIEGTTQYVISIDGDYSETGLPEKKGGDPGETIIFWVDGNICNEAGVWSQQSAYLDLHFNS